MDLTYLLFRIVDCTRQGPQAEVLVIFLIKLEAAFGRSGMTTYAGSGKASSKLKAQSRYKI
jgi:hypothetical protein